LVFRALFSWSFSAFRVLGPLSLWQKWVPRNFLGGKVRLARRSDNSAVLVEPNVKVRMNAKNCIPLWVYRTFYGKALPLPYCCGVFFCTSSSFFVIHLWSKRYHGWILPSSGLLHGVNKLDPWKMGLIGNAETSVSNRLTPRINTQDGGIRERRHPKMTMSWLSLNCTKFLID
jgi:hypothetical protein